MKLELEQIHTHSDFRNIFKLVDQIKPNIYLFLKTPHLCRRQVIFLDVHRREAYIASAADAVDVSFGLLV